MLMLATTLSPVTVVGAVVMALTLALGFGAWESKTTCGVSYTLTVQHGQLASSQPGGSVY